VKLALLALLAFAVPAPFAESFPDEEIAVQQCRPSLKAIPSKERVTVPSSAPVPRPVEQDLPPQTFSDWTPSSFTRPPPIR